jgi:hypothetical protein
MQDRHSSRVIHSLQVTLFLVSEEWPKGRNVPDSYSSRADSFSPSYTLFSVEGMAQGEEYSRLNNQGQSFLKADSFSPGYTLFSVGGMA